MDQGDRFFTISACIYGNQTVTDGQKVRLRLLEQMRVGEIIIPASHDANGATFTGLSVEAGHNLVVYHGGTVWFTVTAQASSDPNE